MAEIERKVVLVLFLIVLLAFTLRLYRLTSVPPSLFGDEVDIGYQAYSILKTGQDYHGNPWPVHFQSFGDWRTPLYLYLTVPSVAILGLTGFAVRFPAALFGVLGVLGTFFLTRELFANSKEPPATGYQPPAGEIIALLASFLLAVSPWHLHYSRAAFEVTLMSTLFIFALFLFLRWTKRPTFVLLFLSSLLFALTPYAYNTAKLFVPLFLFATAFIYRKDFLRFKKQTVLAGLLFLIVLTPLTWDVLKGTGRARFAEISIFSDPKRFEWVAQKRRNETLPESLGILLYNKATFWLRSFTQNYLQAFSPQFLFLTGDPNLRHSLGDRGELYLLELPFLLLGWWALFQEKVPGRKLLLSWFLLAPFPASLTQDGGTHATRLFFLLPLFQIIAGAGLGTLFQRTGVKKLVFAGVGFLFVASLLFYLHEYYVHYPKESARWWNFGYKQAFAYTESVKENYERIYFTQSYEPTLIYFLYFTSFEPAKFQKIAPGPDQLEKYIFQRPNLTSGVLPNTLYVLAPGDPGFDGQGLPVKELEKVVDPAGNLVFKIVASK